MPQASTPGRAAHWGGVSYAQRVQLVRERFDAFPQSREWHSGRDDGSDAERRVGTEGERGGLVDDGGRPGVVGGYAGEEGLLAHAGGEGEVRGGDGEVRVGFCGEGVDDRVGAAAAAGEGPVEVAVFRGACFEEARAGAAAVGGDDFEFEGLVGGEAVFWLLGWNWAQLLPLVRRSRSVQAKE